MIELDFDELRELLNESGIAIDKDTIRELIDRLQAAEEGRDHAALLLHDEITKLELLQSKLDELRLQYISDFGQLQVKPEPIKRGPFESLADFQGKHRFKTSEPMQHYQRRTSDIKVGDL